MVATSYPSDAGLLQIQFIYVTCTIFWLVLLSQSSNETKLLRKFRLVSIERWLSSRNEPCSTVGFEPTPPRVLLNFCCKHVTHYTIFGDVSFSQTVAFDSQWKLK